MSVLFVSYLALKATHVKQAGRMVLRLIFSFLNDEISTPRHTVLDKPVKDLTLLFVKHEGGT